ncbi:AAA family ATPase [Micromonospora sp. NPDC005206]|uniref:McrB family protein n=1 Tax=Micromonospora sp. NPDC005206 TaxID=3157022 RepID=UPI00339F3F1D
MGYDQQSAVDPTPQSLTEVREIFGERFVAARVEAESDARDLLDKLAGSMSVDEALQLGRLFNRHEKTGQVRLDRFSPGFAGAVMNKLTEDIDRFNRVVAELWTSPADEALALLGRMFADRSVLPGAGSSLPSMLLYLRDPERFAVCINATMKGLAHVTGRTFRADGQVGYERFCEVLRTWREQYGVAPQEADALLTNIMRAATAPSVAGPVAEPPTVIDVQSSGRLTVEQVADQCYLPVEQIDKWVAALHGPMRQGVFFGPPGTGKTWVALKLAHRLATSPDHVELVQFHPAYSYEDFVEGLRPDLADGGALRYTPRDGVFFKLCERARKAPSDDVFVLVIDEMNRADLAAVFGELLFLLEYRGVKPAVLPYSQRQFSVPPNIIILGTMNTADRSLALVDFALRRRFNAFHLHPSDDVLAKWSSTRSDVDADLLLGMFRLIRDRVGHQSPVSPGHSYWMVEQIDAATAEAIWSYQLYPYLAEHWFERPEELERLDVDIRALIAERS